MVWSEQHYVRHMLPIFNALPDHLRGVVHPQSPPGMAVRPPMGRIAMVAGWQDVNPLRGQCPMIYVEHGAGQSYIDNAADAAYSGSGGRRHTGVIGFICPNETVASRWTSAPTVAVGCPKMDRYVGIETPTIPTITFAWHWDGSVAPEAKSAWPHYAERMDEVISLYTAMGFRVFVHEHPKWRGKMEDTWAERFHIPPFWTDDEVFKYSSILMVDNSSLAYEFASLGRPVVNLNAPWYRREVHHGLRFWEHVPGIQVEGIDGLLGLNPWDLLGDTPLGRLSAGLAEDAVKVTYAFTDGSSAQRAAQWITDLVAEV